MEHVDSIAPATTAPPLPESPPAKPRRRGRTVLKGAAAVVAGLIALTGVLYVFSPGFRRAWHDTNNASASDQFTCFQLSVLIDNAPSGDTVSIGMGLHAVVDAGKKATNGNLREEAARMERALDSNSNEGAAFVAAERDMEVTCRRMPNSGFQK